MQVEGETAVEGQGNKASPRENTYVRTHLQPVLPRVGIADVGD